MFPPTWRFSSLNLTPEISAVFHYLRLEKTPYMLQNTSFSSIYIVLVCKSRYTQILSACYIIVVFVYTAFLEEFFLKTTAEHCCCVLHAQKFYIEGNGPEKKVFNPLYSYKTHFNP